MWNYTTPGIPDEMFERAENVPITKEEIRTIQLSKARLKEGNTVFDIGCGSGSISVEAGLQIGEGKIHAIDYDQKAIELTKKNLAKFQLNNVSVIHNNAKDAISSLPNADAIFIGGTGGDTAEIVKLSSTKLVSGGRMVVGIILIETLYSVIKTIEALEFEETDIIQVTISKSRKTSTGTMMLARNPVFVISATKK
ncbi:MAG: precorrin-6Y C5,15-methyltransferase (decarboxylating) subunit CbiT [Nitrosopumilaceae archaeon]|nr:precorrin-6Y C5,15-methyltransferase (decarboxylating) subunit CbiT [Nitrosopumilaceae archaeon]NIU01915.1 precorrin-6Y C5,15-methyltransferase (decarboxylating) subunit CbiT [Nitrosopumilaceae archaeon]NIU88319.1 precorrin-6Y C5,15-methyltransferase (decarboxylating) subunit CbiT [Nitrosopumilaceae archaeon]NIV66611.1 precorrin-6Y C5,15-methyltransferase (decarboxylating) subunit CbiT [Nitrosopumilaceae archaeon]NIX62516.1 precorrin-6Y C5,15-methyltransferase (decarboxylating) subunit CbiT 